MFSYNKMIPLVKQLDKVEELMQNKISDVKEKSLFKKIFKRE